MACVTLPQLHTWTGHVTCVVSLTTAEWCQIMSIVDRYGPLVMRCALTRQHTAIIQVAAYVGVPHLILITVGCCGIIAFDDDSILRSTYR